MKFQPDRRPSSLLSRRDQFRLLFMLAALGFMLFATQWAARPRSWNWLFPQQASISAPELEFQELDFRVRDSAPQVLAPETFRAVSRPRESDSVPIDAAARDDLTALRVPPDILKTIEDNVLGVRRTEAEAYAFLLNLIDELPTAEVEARSRRDASFTVLMLHPEEYRGQLVAVEGELRRLEELAGQPPPGIDAVYEGWLFTRDSGTNPYRVVFTQPPPGAMLSESLDPPVPVRLTGYFFKRYGYVSQGGQHVAPMLIAKTFEPLQPIVRGPAEGPQLRNAMLVWIVCILAGAVALGLWFAASDLRYRRSRLPSLAATRWKADPGELEALREAPTIDLEQEFKHLPEATAEPTHAEPQDVHASTSSSGR